MVEWSFLSGLTAKSQVFQTSLVLGLKFGSLADGISGASDDSPQPQVVGWMALASATRHSALGRGKERLRRRIPRDEKTQPILLVRHGLFSNSSMMLSHPPYTWRYNIQSQPQPTRCMKHSTHRAQLS
ncbi:hypothetical protein ACLOJK_013644 [Asimina triloba]